MIASCIYIDEYWWWYWIIIFKMLKLYWWWWVDEIDIMIFMVLRWYKWWWVDNIEIVMFMMIENDINDDEIEKRKKIICTFCINIFIICICVYIYICRLLMVLEWIDLYWWYIFVPYVDRLPYNDTMVPRMNQIMLMVVIRHCMKVWI